MRSEDWRADALCAQTDPDMFFPEPGRVAQDAKTICTRCPVRQQCLTYAINNRMNEGIWGGLTPKQRTRVPREHRCDTCGASVRPGFRYCAPHGVEATTRITTRLRHEESSMT